MKWGSCRAFMYVRRTRCSSTRGEGVLRRAALCKKMEDRLNMTEDLQETVEENPHTDDIAEQEECDLPELNPLTRRMSKAIEQRNALRRQRNDLRCQNKQLQQQKQEMQSSHDNMEIRGGAACRKPQNTPSNTASSKGQGKRAAALKKRAQKKAT